MPNLPNPTMPNVPNAAKLPNADRRGSAFADRQAAVAAVELLLPTLSAALQSDFVGDSGCLHIVIMDPALGPRDASFEDAILYEFSLPDPKDWDADYRAYARAKARLSWETGRDGHVVQALEPYRLRAGDTNLWGAVAQHGIVVGVSGAQPWFDEAFAGCLAHCLRALAKHRAQATPDGLAI